MTTLVVIGAGFGRTGTLSLKMALDELGFSPCEHMTEVFTDPARIALWDQAARAKERGDLFDWERLLAGYRATVDWPGAAFWRELTAFYPNAKVVLTVRDAERWYESAKSTIHRPYELRRGGVGSIGDRLAGVTFRLLERFSARARIGGQMVERVIWRGTFNGEFLDQEHALRVFRDHNAAVMAAIPPDRLLVFEVKEGWEPLCRFLGVPVPTSSFPHANEAAGFQRMIWRRFAVPIAAVAAVLTMMAGIVALAVAGARRRRSRRSR